MGGWAKSINVTPAQDYEVPPFGTLKPERFSTVDRWLEQRDPDFDPGAIHLDAPLGDQLGWFSVAALTDTGLKDHLVNVSGYPAEPGGGMKQWWAMNRIQAVSGRTHILRYRHQRRAERCASLPL